MSIDIDWEKLTVENDLISESIRSFLDQRFQEMKLPSFLKSISVTSFDLGNIPPKVVIQSITDPFPEFYSDEDSQADNDSAVIPIVTADPIDSETSSQHTVPPYYEVDPIINNPTTQSSSFQHLPSTLQQSMLPGIRSPIYSSVHMQSLLSGPVLPKTASGVRSKAKTTSASSSTSNLPQSEASISSSSSDYEQSTPLSNENTTPARSKNDLQVYMHVVYKGDVKVGIETTILLNYPSPNFVSLPLKLLMSGLEINSIAAVAYIEKKIHFSFICDADNEGKPVTLSGKDRVEIIKEIKIESEVGDREGNGPVLRNVGKIERFLLEKLRDLARDELAWPGWITLEL